MGVDERDETVDVKAAALGTFELVVLKLDVLGLVVLTLDVLKLVVLKVNVLELVALGLVLELGVLNLVTLEPEASVALESVVANDLNPMLEEGSRLDNCDVDEVVNSVTLFETEFLNDELEGLADKAVTVVDEYDGRVVVAIETEEGLDVKLEELLSGGIDIDPDTTGEVEIVLLDALEV